MLIIVKYLSQVVGPRDVVSLCDTVTLLPLVILYLEPHHITPESTERSALNQHFLVRICH
jgi:hypothetical protein